MYGGSYCGGRSEEFRICGKVACPEPLTDFRAEQCRRLGKIVDFENTTKENMTWLPHEPEEGKNLVLSRWALAFFQNSSPFFSAANDILPICYFRCTDIPFNNVLSSILFVSTRSHSSFLYTLFHISFLELII